MLVLPAQLTHDSVAEVLKSFEQTTAHQMARMNQAVQASPTPAMKPLIVDGAALQYFDSSAVALLLACRRMANKLGRPLQLKDMPDKLQALTKLYGVSDFLAQS